MAKKILAGLEEAVAHARGDDVEVRLSEVEAPARSEIKAIKDRLGIYEAGGSEAASHRAEG